MAAAEPTRFSLLHGDYRLDNMLFHPDRTRMTMVDWQTLAVGRRGCQAIREIGTLELVRELVG